MMTKQRHHQCKVNHHAQSCNRAGCATPRGPKPVAQRRCRIAHADSARLIAGLCVTAVVLLGGCQGLLRTYPAQRTFQPARDPDSLSDVAFLHYLPTVPVATVDEGMRAILMLVGEAEATGTFEQRFEALRGRSAVKTAWGLRSGQILDKGTLAYMLRSVCGLSRSLGEFLASWTGLGDRRCALRTCIDEGLLPYGVWDEPVKGGGLLSAITEAERYVRSNRRDGS